MAPGYCCTMLALAVCMFSGGANVGTAARTGAQQAAPVGASAARTERAGPPLGFLIGRHTDRLVPLLKRPGDFLEMMVGPARVPHIRALPPEAKAMCVCLNLEGMARTVEILQEAGIEPERVLIMYNPEERPPRAPQCTPGEELEDPVGSLRKARALLRHYPAPLFMAPGLSRMETHEELYPVLARLCDGWMIQTQRLEVDRETWEPVPPEEYGAEVRRVVGMLREGNPDIQIMVQLIPFTRTPELKAAFTPERMVAYVRSIEDVVEGVKLYGGDDVLTERVFELLRGDEGPAAPGRDSERREPDRESRPRRPEPQARPRAEPVGPLVAAEAGGKETVTVPVRDGALLATDIYFPVDYSEDRYPDGVPVILVCTPYDRTREGPTGRWRRCAVNNGYAFAVQDMRGFYGSKNPHRGRSRQNDGYDTTEWFARQPWCNGWIGMMGYSHPGAVQYETAADGSPHLGCAIPAQAPGNYYTNSLYPETFRKADMQTIWRGAFTARTQQLIKRRTRGGVDVPPARFNTPMLHSAGWYDFYTEGAVEMFRALQRHGGPRARGNQKLLIGPWGHGTLQEENPDSPLKLPGGLAYPRNAKLNWEEGIWLPWFGRWLKGEKTGIMDAPSVLYYLMGDVDDPRAPGNRWVEADEFPPPSETVRYYIHPDGTLEPVAPRAESASMSYRYDPRDPVPTVGRVHPRVPVKGPFDQREVEGRDDVLVFTTPVLEEPRLIVGQVRVRLWASSDRTDTDFTAKLTDVYPDGRSMMITDSIVKGRYRNGIRQEELLDPGHPYEFDIDLGYTAIALAPGHRLRLAVSSSNFDRFDINPNTGEPYGDHALTRRLLEERLGVKEFRGKPQYSDSLVATNTIHMGDAHPTHVALPVIPASSLAAAQPRGSSGFESER